MSAPDNNVSSGGWFSAVGRLFAGSGGSVEPTKTTTANNGVSSVASQRLTDKHDISNGVTGNTASSGSRGLRYLSPSALERTKLDTSRHEAVKDIFSETATRKRLLNPESPTLEPISQAVAKRFRGLANHSLIEEPVRVSIGDKLDSTWAGGFTSFVHPSSSPASSIRSLRSRVSDFSTSTGLSSKTRTILHQLERVSTPSKDAKKLPAMRGSGGGSEKWAGLHASLGGSSTTSAPPLRKSMGAVPSRAQLLSSSIGTNRRKPYWRDIVRKPNAVTSTSDNTSSLESSRPSNSTQAADANGSMLHPLFDTGTSPKKPAPSSENGHVSSIVKGSDGKGRNKFSALELDDTILNSTPLPMEPLPMSMNAAPPTGFIDDVAFIFAAPKERKLGVSVVVEESDHSASVDDSSEESSDDSTSSEEDSGSNSETESNDKSLDNKKGKEDESRPPTSTDSETTATATPASSKNVSPLLNQQKEKGESPEDRWDCSACFVSNTGSECVCCHTKKGGTDAPTAAKTLVSNISTFASSNAPTGVSFGFGGGNAVSSTTPSFGLGSSSSGSTAIVTPSQQVANSNGLVTVATTPAPATAAGSAASTEKRVDWSCPDCFINNKSTADKCCACGHVMYKSTSGASINVFGDRAFKPAATATAPNVVFGLGNKDSSSSKPVAFGIAPASSASVTFGIPSNAANNQDATKLVAPANTEAQKPLFGDVNRTSLFGAITSAASVPTPSAPLFGSMAPTPSSAVKPNIATPSSTAAPKNDDKPATFSAPSTSLFGSSSANLFGAVTTTADKPTQAPVLSFGAPAAAPISNLGSLFNMPASSTNASSTVPTLSFGAGTPTPSIGSGMNLFGAPAPTADRNVPSSNSRSDDGAPATKKMFGTSSTVAENKPAPAFSFGSSGSTATNGFATSSASTIAPLFGTSNSTPSFGAFNTPAALPTMSNSSSTNSLFNAATASSEPPKAFNFGAPQLPAAGGFNFGGTPAVNSTSTFVFGQTAAPAAPSGVFAFGAAPATANAGAIPSFSSDPAPAGGAFAFNASSGGGPSVAARKMANARRRNVPRRNV